MTLSPGLIPPPLVTLVVTGEDVTLREPSPPIDMPLICMSAVNDPPVHECVQARVPAEVHGEMKSIDVPLATGVLLSHARQKGITVSEPLAAAVSTLI